MNNSTQQQQQQQQATTAMKISDKMHKREKFPNCCSGSGKQRDKIYRRLQTGFCVFSVTQSRENEEEKKYCIHVYISERASNDNNNSNHYVEQHINFKVA